MKMLSNFKGGIKGTGKIIIRRNKNICFDETAARLVDGNTFRRMLLFGSTVNL
jgi:hypothetical protein